MTEITLQLPDDVLDSLAALAERLGTRLDDLVQEALRADKFAPQAPRRADDRMRESMSTLVAADLAAATSWFDLARRLAPRNLELQPDGGALHLQRRLTGERFCRTSDIGFTYASLCRRFGGPMPVRAPGSTERAPARPPRIATTDGVAIGDAHLF